MVIRYIILAGMVGTASLAQAGPVNFGGLGGAGKSALAVGATTKVGEFGRGNGAPAPAAAPVAYYTGGDSSPGGGAPFASESNTPAPFAEGSGFNVGPANPSSLGNGGVTGGPSAPPPFANAAPAAPAAPVATPAAPAAAPAAAVVPAAPAVVVDPAPRADEVAAETPALQAPTAPAADIGNAEELLEVLIPATGVPDADKLPTALAPLADPEAAIPEPATGFLMLAGLLGAGVLSRRRKGTRQI